MNETRKWREILRQIYIWTWKLRLFSNAKLFFVRCEFFHLTHFGYYQYRKSYTDLVERKLKFQSSASNEFFTKFIFQPLVLCKELRRRSLLAMVVPNIVKNLSLIIKLDVALANFSSSFGIVSINKEKREKYRKKGKGTGKKGKLKVLNYLPYYT